MFSLKKHDFLLIFQQHTFGYAIGWGREGVGSPDNEILRTSPMEHHKAFGPAGPVFLPCLLRRAHGRECRGRLRSSGIGERSEGVGRGCPRSAGRLHGGPDHGRRRHRLRSYGAFFGKLRILNGKKLEVDYASFII